MVKCVFQLAFVATSISRIPWPSRASCLILACMARKPLRLHVDTIVRKHGGKTYVSHLLRHSYRDGAHVRHRTLANLSHLPPHTLDLVRRSLKGEVFVTPPQAFRITSAKAHGHVHAVLGT